MPTIPAQLHERLRRHDQDHVLRFWDRLSAPEQNVLLTQLTAIDLEQLTRLYEQRDHSFPLPSGEQIQPVPVIPADRSEAAEQLGQQALDRGEVAALVVAGGQGTRLGFNHPKGMYPVGPVSRKSLFQVHAEKVLALGRRHGKPIPLLVMTSDATDTQTRQFFAEHQCFGLAAEHVHFFQQGTMPALDMTTGKLLLESPGRLCLSPNGHGGTLTALADSGLLDQLADDGIRDIFYFQVDNPLVKVADPTFIGHHRLARAEVSSKVVEKREPTEKVGHLVQVDRRCSIIEYIDLTREQVQERDEGGRLRLWAGNPAIHLFSVEFLKRITQGQTRLPFHIARKKVPHIDDVGQQVKPEKENALKFEMFVFDALPLADRWTVVETMRAEEFEPLKNASGADSPATVAQAISNLAGKWLEAAGVRVPRDGEGNVAVALEISPLFALDARELAGKVKPDLRIEGPTYLDSPASCPTR